MAANNMILVPISIVTLDTRNSSIITIIIEERGLCQISIVNPVNSWLWRYCISGVAESWG